MLLQLINQQKQSNSLASNHHPFANNSWKLPHRHCSSHPVYCFLPVYIYLLSPNIDAPADSTCTFFFVASVHWAKTRSMKNDKARLDWRGALLLWFQIHFYICFFGCGGEARLILQPKMADVSWAMPTINTSKQQSLTRHLHIKLYRKNSRMPVENGGGRYAAMLPRMEDGGGWP